MRVTLPILLAAGMLVPAPHATAEDLVVPASSFDALKGRAPVGQTIYVETAEIPKGLHVRGFKGKLVGVSGSTLRLQVKDDVREFSESNVLMVSQRHDHRGQGAALGLVAGLLGGGWAVAQCGEGDECWAMLGAIFGTITSTSVGYGIGRSIQHERPLFVSPDLRESLLTTSVRPVIGPRRIGVAATFRF